MKEDRAGYYNAIGMSDLSVERAELMLDLLKEVAPAEVQHVFVSDRLKEGGSRSHTDLAVWTSGYLVNMKSFMTSEKFEFFPRLKSMTLINLATSGISKKGMAESESATVTAQCELAGNSVIMLTATGENCAYLLGLVKDVLFQEMWMDTFAVSKVQIVP